VRRAAKRDANEAEIVKALREEGFQVLILGLPVDLLVWKPGGKFMFLEVKTDKGLSTEVQRKFFDSSVGCPRAFVRTPEEALSFARAHEI